MALHIVDQRQQAVTQFDAQQVQRQGGRNRFFLGRRIGFGLFLRLFLGGAGILALEGVIGERAGTGGKSREHHGRHARQYGNDAHHGGGHAQRLGIEGQLLDQRLVGGAFDASLGNHQARGGRNNQRRHLRHQAVTHCQQGEGLSGVAKAHALLGHGDNDAADNIDAHDQKTGNGITAHKFAGAVHRAEEIAFRFQILAALLGFFFINQAGRQIGIHRHLLAGHRVQTEACGDFGDTARTLGDDDEVDDDQNGENDQADDEVALHDQLAEGLDDITRGSGALGAMPQNQPG